MERWLGQIALGLAALTTLTFGASNLLLSGEDPSGWWNFVPAYIFYATIFVLIPAVGLVALVYRAIRALEKFRACRSSPS